MRVAAVQYKPRKGRVRSSLRALVRLAETAARQADLVVLPEMAATGYLFPTPSAVAPFAEDPSGRTFQAFSSVAAAHAAWIVAGFPERATGAYYNSAMVIDPTGALRFVYRKTLLYPPDEWWAVPGDSGYRAFDTDVGRFGVGICMDLNDDRFTRWCRTESLDAIAFPTNWVDEDELPWDYWRRRIQGTGAALVAANTYGPEASIDFVGRSAVVTETAVVASGPASGDAVVTATIRRTPPSS